MKNKNASFRITGGKGFHLTFPNGVTVSVQFGPGNYCDNYDDDMMEWVTGKGRKTLESMTAEIAIWKKGGEWIKKDYHGEDKVSGYKDINEVWKIFEWAKEYEIT